jgi:hypothetical protein
MLGLRVNAIARPEFEKVVSGCAVIRPQHLNCNREDLGKRWPT